MWQYLMQNPAMWQMFMRGAQGPTSRLATQQIPRMAGGGVPATVGGGMPAAAGGMAGAAPTVGFNAGRAASQLAPSAALAGAGAMGGSGVQPIGVQPLPILDQLRAWENQPARPSDTPPMNFPSPPPEDPMAPEAYPAQEDRIRPMPTGPIPKKSSSGGSSGAKKSAPRAQPGLLGDGSGDDDWLKEFFRRNSQAAIDAVNRNQNSNR